MSNKPTVFNYAEHEKALKRIEELEHEVEELRKQRTNLEIKCRILEEERSKIGTKRRNDDIRRIIADNGFKHWEVAERIGLNNTAFSRMLRYDLTTDQKHSILLAIDQLIEERKNG